MAYKVGARGTVAERFEAKYIPEPNSGCWLWLGALDGHGYGHMYINGRYAAAYRVGYELAKGPIPDGMVIDHLCRTPICVNPDHLEAVTQSINLLRSPLMGSHNRKLTHCRRGHEFSAENTRIRNPRGWRSCIACEKNRKSKNG
jgi:hypothetical protein